MRDECWWKEEKGCSEDKNNFDSCSEEFLLLMRVMMKKMDVLR